MVNDNGGREWWQVMLGSNGRHRLQVVAVMKW